MEALVLGFSDYAEQGRRLAEALSLPYAETALHRFPDEESLVRLPTELPPHLIVCRSLDRPNDKLIELMLTARTARSLGVRRLTLVAPYLCYMRQDAAMHPGESVSQRIVGQLLAELFDDLVTVDPHLHRVAKLRQAVPLGTAACLHAAEPIGEFVAAELDHPLVLAPDQEAEQWVKLIAAPRGLDYATATKQRRGDRDVSIDLPSIPVTGRSVLVVDDVASSGGTLAVVARELEAAGAAEINVVLTHALFAQGAMDAIRQTPIRNIWSTDSIRHDSNTIELGTLLAEAVQRLRGSASR